MYELFFKYMIHKIRYYTQYGIHTSKVCENIQLKYKHVSLLVYKCILFSLINVGNGTPGEVEVRHEPSPIYL